MIGHHAVHAVGRHGALPRSRPATPTWRAATVAGLALMIMIVLALVVGLMVVGPTGGWAHRTAEMRQPSGAPQAPPVTHLPR